MKNSLPLLSLGLLLAACGGDDNVTNIISGDGGASAKPLVTTTNTAANSTCPTGGVTVAIGLDTNGDGVLQPGEVTSSQEICGASAGGSDGGTTGRVLTLVTSTGSDEKCANGGFVVASGVDTNGNGVLDPSEVTSSQEVCNGGTSNVLTITTPLPVGNANCPLGGEEVQSGVDNGAGDGGAGDGILEPGEITSTTYICGTGVDAGSGTFAPPAPVMNQPAYTIKANGGTGTAGVGGNAGSFAATLDAAGEGNGGASLAIYTTGVATPTATAPTPTPAFGATKLDVTTNTTLAVHANATDAVDGEYYFLAGKLVHRVSATELSDAVTGLHVAAGVTLTSSLTTGMTALANDIFVEGTVTGATAGQAVSLVTSGLLDLAAASTVSTTGSAATTTTASSAGGAISLSGGSVVLGGTIDASGGAGLTTTAGANAGSIALRSGGSLYATGTVRANGGAGGTSSGAGGAVIFAAQTMLAGGAAVTANGGDGLANASAGNAGGLTYTCGIGQCDLMPTATVKLTGGNAAATCTGACNGGKGGVFSTTAVYGLIAAADVTVTGGTGGGTGAGGSGGSCSIGRNVPEGGTVSSIQMSGSFDASGGTGAVGGAGGTVSFGDADYLALGQNNAYFYGYSAISANGGSGTTGGGNGGTITVSNGREVVAPFNDGNAILYTPITATGGKAMTSGAGGAGGSMTFAGGTTGIYDSKQGGFVQLAASVDVSGADGVSSGGNAGSVAIEGFSGVVSSGALTSKGGNASAGNGGSGTGALELVSSALLANSGTITAAGGNGVGTNAQGGNAPSIVLQASGALTNSAALTSTGGSSQGVVGGNGGNISVTGSPSTNTGATTSTGGTGSTNGAAGTVTVN